MQEMHDNQTKRRIAIVGSRGFSNLELVDALIYKLDKTKHEIVSGGAIGPDTQAQNTAILNGFEVQIFYPDWSQGKGAGMARNSEIVAYADDVYAFYDGKSRGTLDSMKKAVAAGKLRRVFNEYEETNNIVP